MLKGYSNEYTVIFIYNFMNNPIIKFVPIFLVNLADEFQHIKNKTGVSACILTAFESCVPY